ncbi:MAG: acyl transferase [Cyclobacteriaceae bacterium]
MQTLNNFKEAFNSIDENNFEEFALQLFYFQYKNNPVYKSYVDYLGLRVKNTKSTNEIPFLPIEFFKKFEIKTCSWKSQTTFMSSGTTASVRSRHHVEDLYFYRQNTLMNYERFFDSVSDTTILALLPSYQEQGNSSLIDMVDYFMSRSNSVHSGYYLDDYEGLNKAIELASKHNKSVVLFGVSFALLEYAKFAKNQNKDIIVIETGGMKGRGPEYTKMEMYDILKQGLNVREVYSEYGMTELMSQAYSKGAGLFQTPYCMKVDIRDVNDPFKYLEVNKTGSVNVIDLANIHSCAFIETQDLGVKRENKKFEILGRIDNSDLRGCNLLVS